VIEPVEITHGPRVLDQPRVIEPVEITHVRTSPSTPPEGHSNGQLCRPTRETSTKPGGLPV